MNKIKVYCLVSLYDESGLHKAGTIAKIPEDEFNSDYMKRIPDLPSGDGIKADVIADAYVEAIAPTVYEPGDIVYKNIPNPFYKCLKETSGSWDSTAWEQLEVITYMTGEETVPSHGYIFAVSNNTLYYNKTTSEQTFSSVPPSNKFTAVLTTDYDEGTRIQYTVGAYVMYENELYACKETTSGAFDPTKWEKINVYEMIRRMINA